MSDVHGQTGPRGMSESGSSVRWLVFALAPVGEVVAADRTAAWGEARRNLPAPGRAGPVGCVRRGRGRGVRGDRSHQAAPRGR